MAWPSHIAKAYHLADDTTKSILAGIATRSGWGEIGEPHSTPTPPPRPLLRSLPLAKQCSHNTGENGRAKAGCTTCVTYGCKVKGTVRVSDCVYCTDYIRQDQRTTDSTYHEDSVASTEISSHENRALEAGNAWLPVNGEWVKDPNVWPMFRDMIQQEIATLE